MERERERARRGFGKEAADPQVDLEPGWKRPVVGKRTLTEMLPPMIAAVQRKAAAAPMRAAHARSKASSAGPMARSTTRASGTIFCSRKRGANSTANTRHPAREGEPDRVHQPVSVDLRVTGEASDRDRQIIPLSITEDGEGSFKGAMPTGKSNITGFDLHSDAFRTLVKGLDASWFKEFGYRDTAKNHIADIMAGSHVTHHIIGGYKRLLRDLRPLFEA
jgi:hypothetical protein